MVTIDAMGCQKEKSGLSGWRSRSLHHTAAHGAWSDPLRHGISSRARTNAPLLATQDMLPIRPSSTYLAAILLTISWRRSLTAHFLATQPARASHQEVAPRLARMARRLEAGATAERTRFEEARMAKGYAENVLRS